MFTLQNELHKAYRDALEASPPLALTPRERGIVVLLDLDMTTKDIATRLFLSVGTVKVYLVKIRAKNGNISTAQLLSRYRTEMRTRIDPPNECGDCVLFRRATGDAPCAQAAG